MMNGKIGEHSMCIAADYHKQIIEIVRYAAGELPDAL